MFIIICLGWNHLRSGSRSGLFTYLSVSHRHIARLDEAEITAVVQNHGPTNAIVNTSILGNSILSVEVLNSRGELLPPIPPSIPPPDLKSYERILLPGESLKFSYHLFYQVKTPSGRYTVRMRDLPSNQIVLTIH